MPEPKAFLAELMDYKSNEKSDLPDLQRILADPDASADQPEAAPQVREAVDTFKLLLDEG